MTELPRYRIVVQFFARISLPALDNGGGRTVFTATIDCAGVPSLDVEVIGILGRMFLRGSRLTVDGVSGRVEFEMSGDLTDDR